MSNYELQIKETCIRTWYNLYGVMPGPQELMEMLGDAYNKVIPIIPEGPGGSDHQAA